MGFLNGNYIVIEVTGKQNVHCIVLNLKKIWISLVVPQIIKYKATIRPSNSIPKYIFKGNENTCLHRNVYMSIHSSITHYSQKRGNTPNIHQVMNKMWHIYKMEYYSPVKGKEILTHNTTQMNPENMLSKMNQ